MTVASRTTTPATATRQFFSPRPLWIGALAALVAAGLGIRLFDLTDLPLDFHPTRQLLSAIKARGMYYQRLPAAPEWKRDFAVREWKFRARVEPEVLERLVAITYRAAGEQVWAARIYSSVFWVLGALSLFYLGRRLVSVDGALVAVAVYLFLPYAVVASRSFQPDPLMVMLVVTFWWALVSWSDTVWQPDAGQDSGPAMGEREADSPKLAWRFAALAGAVGGIAIFVKLTAAFFVIPAALASVLGREPLRQQVRRGQIWLMAILGIIPAALYLAYGLFFAGYLGQQFEGRFFATLFLSPSYYAGWINVVNLVVGPATVTLGLAGALLFPRRGARLIVGLWVGYLLYGLYFNYHISTHDYYSLILIPIVALSLAPVGAALFSIFASRLTSPASRLAVLAVLGIGLLLGLLDLRHQLARVNYRPEAEMWQQIGERLGRDARVLALTQDYGMRLTYWGWLAPTPWPSTGDLRYHALRGANQGFEREFERLATNRDYFLVTDFDELARQPDLEAKLSTLSVVEENPRYVILDLAAERAE